MPIRLRSLSWRDLLFVVLPSLLAMSCALWVAAQFIDPAPPKSLTMAVGPDGSADHRFALMYRDVLARHGIQLEIRPSMGTAETLKLLRAGEVDAGFLQVGQTGMQEGDSLHSLGEFYLEPLWIFYSKRAFQRLRQPPSEIRQLRGHSVAIGADGSDTQRLALEILTLNGLDGSSVRTVKQGGLELIGQLADGSVEAVMVVGPVQSALVWSLLYAPGVGLMNLVQAPAYASHLPWLTQLSLPRGAVDMQLDIPSHDLTPIAPTASLIVRESLHPALAGLLMQAGSEVHGGASLFQRTGQFPRPGVQGEFPLSPEADRYFKHGRPFLQRYLPFWAATLIDRTLVMLLPLIAVVLPLLRFAPALYTWRVRSRIYRRYGELKFLESEVGEEPEKHSRAEWLARLDRIEQDVNELPTPLAFADMLYTLRSHIDLVRQAVVMRTRPDAQQDALSS